MLAQTGANKIELPSFASSIGRTFLDVLLTVDLANLERRDSHGQGNYG